MDNVGKLFEVPAGSRVLTEGEINLDMYKIVKGHAEVYIGYGTDHETLIGIIGPQACFGEFGLLLEKPAIYTIIAYSDLLLLQITKGELGDFVQQNHRTIIQIMQNMAMTMQAMHAQIDMLIHDNDVRNNIDQRMSREMQKAIGRYTVYRNAAMEGKFHTIDSIKDRVFR